MDRQDPSFVGSEPASRLWSVMLPLLVVVVAVAVVAGLVFGGVVQGGKTYPERPAAQTTAPTVIIEPRRAVRRRAARP